MELGQFALDIIVNLLASVIYNGTSYKALPFFERRRIESRIVDATAEVVEPLLPFLAQEKVSEDQQRRLLQTCVDELRPLTQNPERFFQGSLDGQKVFEEMYANRNLPQVVVEDGLKDVYTLLCPRIATLLCKIPAAVKDWENEAWSENYKRLDEITSQIRKLFGTVDALANSSQIQADETLSVLRRTLGQKLRLELDLTGLRADRPLAGKFEDFFVHPEIQRKENSSDKKPQTVGTPDDGFNQFVRPHYQALVIGHAGTGKSTWTKWLQRETISSRWVGLGIRVELRRLSVDDLLSIHDLIREAAGKHLSEDITAERISQWLKSKQVVFILDGFDEIRPIDRGKIYDWIIDLQTAARGCPFILTSRPITTNHIELLGLGGWHEWSINPFDETRITDYIQRWYTYTPLLPDGNRSIEAEALAKTWRTDPTIGPLTGNPLLLSTLLMVHHLDGSLPSGRSQLYRRYVDGMLGLWDDRRQVSATSIQLTLDQKRNILRGFALRLFLHEKDQLDEPETLEWLSELLEKEKIPALASEVLAGLRERSGLIVGPGIYSFSHKSIAEYLVAETVLQGNERDYSEARIDRFRLFEHRDSDQWNTVTFLWSGLASIADVEAFIEACVEAENWQLAFGILWDQYDRVPRSVCRNLLLTHLVRRPHLLEIDREDSRRWLFSSPKSLDTALGVPDFSLRGVVPNKYFSDIVSRAAKDKTIAWSDQVDTANASRDLLWMTFCCESVEDISTWKHCLAAPCPTNGTEIAWLFWVAEVALMKAQTEEGLDIEEIVTAYQEVCPNACKLIPLALMSVAIRTVSEQSSLTKKTSYKGIKNILRILPGSDKGKMFAEWLLGTHEWILAWGKEPLENIGDLLGRFAAIMENLARQGNIEKDSIYNSAMGYVKTLKHQRSTLNKE